MSHHAELFILPIFVNCAGFLLNLSFIACYTVMAQPRQRSWVYGNVTAFLLVTVVVVALGETLNVEIIGCVPRVFFFK